MNIANCKLLILEIVELSAVPSIIIMVEKYVIKPNPLPNLPNTCCSIGALLKSIAKIICRMNKIASVIRIRLVAFFEKKLIFVSKFGNKYIARAKRSAIFGSISESKLYHGVNINPTAADTHKI